MNRERSQSSSRRSSASNPPTRQSPAGGSSLAGPVNTSARSHTPSTAPSADNISAIETVVGNLTQAINDSASARVAHDVAKHRSDLSNKEHSSLKHNFSDFPALAEQKARVKKRADQDLDEAASLLRERQEVLSTAVTRLVSSAAPPKRDEAITPSTEVLTGYVSRREHDALLADFKRMQNQMNDIQATMRNSKEEVEILRQNSSEDYKVIQKQLAKVDSNIASSRNPVDFTRLQTQVASLTGQAQSHGLKISSNHQNVQSETDQLGKRITDLEQDKILSLNRRVDANHSSVQKLEEVMSKLEKSNGNAALEVEIAALNLKVGAYETKVSSLDAMRERMTTFDTRLTSVEDSQKDKFREVSASLKELSQTPTRISNLEAQVPKIGNAIGEVSVRVLSLEGDRQQNVMQTGGSADHQLIADLNAEIDKIKAETDSLGNIAKIKDELLGENLEKIQKDITDLRSTTDGADSILTNLRSQVDGLRMNADKAGTEVTNLRRDVMRQGTNASINGGQFDPHLKDRVDTVSVGLQALEGRFNNLTTDDMAQKMVRQMEQIYPNAAQIKQIGNDVERLDINHKQTAGLLRQALMERQELGQKITYVDTAIRNLLQTASRERQDLANRITNVNTAIRNDIAADFAGFNTAIDVKFKTVAATVQQVGSNLGTTKTEMTADIKQEVVKREEAIAELEDHHSELDKAIKKYNVALGVLEAEVTTIALNVGMKAPGFRSVQWVVEAENRAL